MNKVVSVQELGGYPPPIPGSTMYVRLSRVLGSVYIFGTD